MDDKYEQHENFSNSCYLNGDNISSRSNIRSNNNTLCIGLTSKETRTTRKEIMEVQMVIQIPLI